MIFSLTAVVYMQNAFDGIAESGQKQWKKRFLWCFATRVIDCIFFVTRWSAVSVFPMHIPMQFICGRLQCTSSFPTHTPVIIATRHLHLQSIHLFPDWTSFFSDVPSAVVFLHFWQTHIHMCINITNIRLHSFSRSIFLCIYFCIRCKFIF